MTTHALLVACSLGLALLGCGTRPLPTAADGGTLVDGGAKADTTTPRGTEPLVLFYRTPDPAGGEPTTDSLPVVDRHGKTVFDLRDKVRETLGTDSFAILEMAVGRRSVSFPSSFRDYWPRLLPGQKQPLTKTQVVLVARVSGAQFGRLLGFSAGGTLTFNTPLSKSVYELRELQLSPSERYLWARVGDESALVDLRHMQALKLGKTGTYQRAFAPHQDTFAYLKKTDLGWHVVLRDLTTRDQRKIPLPASVARDRLLTIQAATPQGFVLGISNGPDPIRWTPFAVPYYEGPARR